MKDCPASVKSCIIWRSSRFAVVKGVAYTLLMCWFFCLSRDVWDRVGGSKVMEVTSKVAGKLNVFD